MSLSEPALERLWPLIEAACLGTISDRQTAELQDALRGNAELQRLYLEYCRMHAELRYLCRAGASNDAAMAKIAAGMDELIPRPSDSPPMPHFDPLGGAYRSATAYLSEHHVVFSYLVAAACFLFAALVGSVVYVSHKSYDRITQTAPSTGIPAENDEIQFVGQITGMKDCRWADLKTAAYNGAFVPLGRSYALASGLMEITYRSGARVILEGPCHYQVESEVGGYLALGKLTALVEKRSEVRGRRSEVGGLAASAASAKPPAANPKAPSLQIPKFSVCTPTAIVTDLGTEFGVEVNQKGNTVSYVYRGKVELRAANGKRTGVAPTKTEEDQMVRLGAGESARVEREGDSGDLRLTFDKSGSRIPKFVRRIYVPPKFLDLLDIVAGGNGTGNHREGGVDPVSGAFQGLFEFDEYRYSGSQFLPVGWHALIDGVFVPDVRSGSVQLDSADHRFDGFPFVSGASFGTIWSRSADFQGKKHPKIWMYRLGDCSKIMPDGHGLLGMHANSGISLSLEGMRKMYRGLRPVRFQAIAAMGDPAPSHPNGETSNGAAVWVFVDGRLKFKRMDLKANDSFKVDVVLGPEDRFLTLVSTDGGKMDASGWAAISLDWILFGDPVLRLAPLAPVKENIEPEQQTQDRE